MKFKRHFFVLLLVAGLVQPVLAACFGDVLPDYVKNPADIIGPYKILSGSQLALVKVIAVHPDRQSKSRTPFSITGVLDLSLIESTGKSLPKTFSVSYQQRHADIMIDCDTWDHIMLRPGSKLLAFFRPEGSKWVVPDIHAMNIVSNEEGMSLSVKKQLQPFFRTRL